MLRATATRRHTARHPQIHMPQPERASAADMLELLHRLDTCCADGAYGFAACADLSNVSQHRALFRKRAQQYDAECSQLQALMSRMGASPEQRQAASDGPHRGWVAVHGTLCGLCDASIVAECERGEALAQACYRQALDTLLPAGVRSLLERQMRDVETSLQQIRMLRDTLRATVRGAA
jgi:uncharacterized protein (TIGR02284 family)